jgi:hypothetical protein
MKSTRNKDTAALNFNMTGADAAADLHLNKNKYNLNNKSATLLLRTKLNNSNSKLLINNNITKENNTNLSLAINKEIKKNSSYNNFKHNQNLRFFLETKTEEVNKIKMDKKIKESLAKLGTFNSDTEIYADGNNNFNKSGLEKKNNNRPIIPLFNEPLKVKNFVERKGFEIFFGEKNEEKKNLNELIIDLKQYNLNLNEFKGSKLDLILFLRNDLNINLKSILSNISYKIEFIKQLLKLKKKFEKFNYKPKNSKDLEILNKLTFFDLYTKKEQKQGLLKKKNKLFMKSNSQKKKTRMEKLNKLALAPASSSNKKQQKPLFSPDQKRDNSIIKKKIVLVNKLFLGNIKTILNNYYKISHKLTFKTFNKKNYLVRRKDIKHLFVLKYLFKPIFLNNPITTTRNTIKNKLRNNILNKKFNKKFNDLTSYRQNGQMNQIKFNKTDKELKDLLLKLNNLLKIIEYKINIINIKQNFLNKMKLINNSDQMNNNNKNKNKNNIKLKNNININYENNYNKDLYLTISNGMGMVNENKIKIDETIKSISNNTTNNYNLFNNNNEINSLQDKGIFIKKFDPEIDAISINSNPVDLLYFNNNINKPVLNDYLKSMSTYNIIRKGTIMNFSNIIAYSFNKLRRKFRPEAQNIYKLLYSSFKSMHSLISKPVFIIKSDKIIIKLFYFLLIPRFLRDKKKNKFTIILQKIKKKIFNKNSINKNKFIPKKFKVISSDKRDNIKYNKKQSMLYLRSKSSRLNLFDLEEKLELEKGAKLNQSNYLIQSNDTESHKFGKIAWVGRRRRLITSISPKVKIFLKTEGLKDLPLAEKKVYALNSTKSSTPNTYEDKSRLLKINKKEVLNLNFNQKIHKLKKKTTVLK